MSEHAGYSLMVVEDVPDIREALTELLCDAGYDVVSAENGREALDLLRLRKQRTHLILLDMLMPIMGGESFRDEQMKDPALAQIPVLILSATFDSRRALALHAAGCMKKPYEPERLLEMIAQIWTSAG